MAQFVYNPGSVFSLETQWERHLSSNRAVSDPMVAVAYGLRAYNERANQTDEILKQGIQAQIDQVAVLDDTLHEGFGQMQEGISDLHEQMVSVEETTALAALAQINVARQNTAQIVGALELGTEHVTTAISQEAATTRATTQQEGAAIRATIQQGTHEISAALLDIGAVLHQDLSMLFDQQRVGNLLLGNIAELLRVPDFQKERLYYMEQGFKHYKNAAIDPSMMEDALENLQKAEEREKTDYILLHRLGMIFLYSADHLDIATAEDYFLRAGRYAAVESDPQAVRLAQLLTGDLNMPLSGQQAKPDSIRQLAADSYLQAAFACHLQGKKEEAVAHAQRAVEIASDWGLAAFKLARYLVINDQIENALPLLENLIATDRYQAVIVADDPDLAGRPEIVALLEQLQEQARTSLNKELKELVQLEYFDKLQTLRNVSLEKLENIVKISQSGSYLDLLSAFDEVAELRLIVPFLSGWDAPFAPEMVVIPPGTFLMGDDYEGPVHEVAISQPFAMGKYAVTFEEWDAYAADTGGYKPDDEGWGRGRRPVINVSWEDAQDYIKWLNRKTGQIYRLPTEAEWEYACRAGTTTAYSFGDSITKQQAQFSEGDSFSAGQTTEVGKYPANQFGLHDMHGNVWEWCNDWYGTYESGPQTDPKGPNSGSRRVDRGGDWAINAGCLRSAYRGSGLPDSRSGYPGFRLLRQPS